MTTITSSEIARLVDGAVDLEWGDEWVRPWRIRLADRPFHHPAVVDTFAAGSPAGVRLRFATTSRHVALIADLVPPSRFPAPEATADLRCGDSVVRCGVAVGEGATFTFEGLPPGEKELELWLPTLAAVHLRSLTVDDDASIESVTDPRPRWVTHGSSITHCAWVPGPTDTWPARAAHQLDWHLTCLGFNGQCHMDPYVARTIASLPADVITVKIGINIHNYGSFRERAFGPAAHGFIQTIRDGHPTTPLTLVSPIISPEREDSGVSNIPVMVQGGEPIHGDLSLNRMREILAEVVHDRRVAGDQHLDYLDGRELLGPADVEHLPDGLHPDPTGYSLMADRFAAHFAERAALLAATDPR